MTGVLTTARPRRRTARAATRASLGLGPALVTAVAYVDPGNVATNFSAGSAYGYRLLWVVVGSTAAAGLVQYLSAKLGACTGRSLTQSLADRLGPQARIAYWVQAELVSAATDIAEVVGGAIGLRLLFGLPLWAGAVAVAAASTALLRLRTTRGANAFALAITGALLLIGCGFVGCAIAAGPTAHGIASGMRPALPDGHAAFLASGIFGATVMPHAVYVHSALSSRGARPPGSTGQPSPARIRALLSANRSGVLTAMLAAGAINAALLLTAAALPLAGGSLGLRQVHTHVAALLGPLPACALALALLVSGLASASVGTHAGDIAMRDLLHRRAPAWARRLATLTPAVALPALGLDTTHLLVLSQVGLSLGIPFALIPLVSLTARRRSMGTAANHRATTAIAATVAAAAVGINALMLFQLA